MQKTLTKLATVNLNLSAHTTEISTKIWAVESLLKQRVANSQDWIQSATSQISLGFTWQESTRQRRYCDQPVACTLTDHYTSLTEYQRALKQPYWHNTTPETSALTGRHALWFHGLLQSLTLEEIEKLEACYLDYRIHLQHQRSLPQTNTHQEAQTQLQQALTAVAQQLHQECLTQVAFCQEQEQKDLSPLEESRIKLLVRLQVAETSLYFSTSLSGCVAEYRLNSSLDTVIESLSLETIQHLDKHLDFPHLPLQEISHLSVSLEINRQEWVIHHLSRQKPYTRAKKQQGELKPSDAELMTRADSIVIPEAWTQQVQALLIDIYHASQQNKRKMPDIRTISHHSELLVLDWVAEGAEQRMSSEQQQQIEHLISHYRQNIAQTYPHELDNPEQLRQAKLTAAIIAHQQRQMQLTDNKTSVMATLLTQLKACFPTHQEGLILDLTVNLSALNRVLNHPSPLINTKVSYEKDKQRIDLLVPETSTNQPQTWRLIKLVEHLAQIPTPTPQELMTEMTQQATLLKQLGFNLSQLEIAELATTGVNQATTIQVRRILVITSTQSLNT